VIASGPLSVLGAGELVTQDPARFSRNASSFFADPVAWLIKAVAEVALEGCREAVRSAADDVAVVVISEYASLQTIQAISQRSRLDRMSPLQFAGASPGLVAGLACITWKFRGPSLVLSMPIGSGLPVAKILAGSWLRSGQAKYVLVCTHVVEVGQHIARSAVVGSRSAPSLRDDGWARALETA
jgi:hypothetical protein